MESFNDKGCKLYYIHITIEIIYLPDSFMNWYFDNKVAG